MVVEQSRGQQFTAHAVEQQSQETIHQSQIPKISSSPRPSILRKRDHEGSPLKAAKNLTTVLANLPPQQTSVSPPPRPDSEGNRDSSGEHYYPLFTNNFSPFNKENKR